MNPEDCVGKTIQSVVRGVSTDNAYEQEEPTVTFVFTDGTDCTIVMPSDD